MAVALELFALHGYDAVGVQQVVEAAGVTKPTLYHYFGSKRGLFESIVNERSAWLVENVQQATIYEGDITWTITQIVRVFFLFAQEQPLFCRMLLAMWFAPPSTEYSPIVKDLLQRLTYDVELMFEQASQQHGNMRGRHHGYAVSLRGIIDTYIGLAFQNYVDLQDEQLIYHVVHQFMYGIFS